MRNTATVTCLAAALAVSPGAASAQDVCPAGTSAMILHVAKLIPGGTLDGVKSAIALHRKWYADHGYTADSITFEPLLVRDGNSPTLVPSADQYITLHTHVSRVPPEKQDDGWKAYIAAYAAQSTVISTIVTCAP